MTYTIREVGNDCWILQGEAMVLRLRGRNASLVVAHAEALRMTGYLTHLNEYLAGVVAGSTYATMVRIGDWMTAPDPRIQLEGGESRR